MKRIEKKELEEVRDDMDILGHRIAKFDEIRMNLENAKQENKNQYLEQFKQEISKVDDMIKKIQVKIKSCP